MLGHLQRLSVILPILFVLGLSSVRSLVAIETAETLLVDLDAADPSAGTASWTNNGTLGDFVEVGDPVVVNDFGPAAVSFNRGGTDDSYQSPENAPTGIVGADATRSIEVWVLNETLSDEETLVAWGHRGGPNGSNMSFNYGTHGAFGAVGHWGGPDIGWNDAGGAPAAGAWHHLVYTYDGETTRVYADGVEANSETLGAGAINTHMGTRITLAVQLVDAAGGLDFSPREGSLVLGRVRVHDGVLTPAQVLSNYEEERDIFVLPGAAPTCANCPQGTDALFSGSTTYARALRFVGEPPPTVEVLGPASAEISADGRLTYQVPSPGPSAFSVALRLSNENGTTDLSWSVIVRDPPDRSGLEVAGELFVELLASDASAGTPFWLNSGTLSDFMEVGDPVITEEAAVRAVTFNSDSTDDAYQSFEDAPAGIVGIDPTRSVEVWAFNPVVNAEETLVAWGRRGGPNGSNVSFNYGTHGTFGAVGHWGAPDIGWNDAGGAPDAGTWHHMVYTYDGTTTRVYADGVESNSETLGAGVINTHAGTKISLAVQIANAAGALEFGGIQGSLSLGAVRIHDGVLTPDQVASNYEREKPIFLPLPQVTQVAGDCNQDGAVNVSDVLCYVGAQFPGFALLGSTAAGCTDPNILSVNGDAVLDLADTVYLANYLFGSGPPPTQGMGCVTIGSEECAGNPGCP